MLVLEELSEAEMGKLLKEDQLVSTLVCEPHVSSHTYPCVCL